MILFLCVEVTEFVRFFAAVCGIPGEDVTPPWMSWPTYTDSAIERMDTTNLIRELGEEPEPVKARALSYRDDLTGTAGVSPASSNKFTQLSAEPVAVGKLHPTKAG